MLAKNPASGGVCVCSFVVSGFFVIAHVAAGGNFVSIAHAVTGAGLGATGLSKRENTGSFLVTRRLGQVRTGLAVGS